MENLVHTYQISDLRHIEEDLLSEQRHTSFKTKLTRQDFEELIQRFKAVLNTESLGFLESLLRKDRPGIRQKSESGWVLRKPGTNGGYDHKLFMHYNDNYAHEHKVAFQNASQELRDFNEAAAYVYDEVTALARHFILLLEQSGFAGIYDRFFTNDRLSLARLRILHYRPHDVPLEAYDDQYVYHAEPHYDDSAFTYALFREKDGLRIGTEDELFPVQYQEGTAFMFAAYGLQTFLRKHFHALFKAPAAYHDVVVTEAEKELDSTSVVAFIGSDDVPEHTSKEVHPHRNSEGASRKGWPKKWQRVA